MYRQYGGTRFYEYHNEFSRKAEQYEILGTPVDWASRDTILYLTSFSGQRTNSCEACHSSAHSTDFCPLNSSYTKARTVNYKQDNYSSASATVSQLDKTRTDSSGRPRLFHNGKEICNNFNESMCSLSHPKSNIIHICQHCKSASHPAHSCFSQRNQSEDRGLNDNSKGAFPGPYH